MKKAFLALILPLLITSCNSNTRVFYINPSKLLQGYHGATVQHELFKAKAKGWQQRVDSLSIELQGLGKATTVARATKEEQLSRYRNVIQQHAQQENQLITKLVLDEINNYIKKYGKDRGCAFILGATENGNIVYAADGTDITEDVLKGLNAQYDSQHPDTVR